jgi:hypothetical protein
MGGAKKENVGQKKIMCKKESERIEKKRQIIVITENGEMIMALVKKLCTAMLLLCLSLVVMVGTAYADDCDLNPRFIRFEKLQPNQPNQRVYVQLVESKDSKVLSNVRIDAYSLENDMQTYSFQAVNPSEPMPVSNVQVEGLRSSPAPQVKDLVVFEEGGAFTSFTVSAIDNFENYFVLSAICADSK